MNSYSIRFMILALLLTVSVAHAEPDKKMADASKQTMPVLNAQGEAASINDISRRNDALLVGTGAGIIREDYSHSEGGFRYIRQGDLLIFRHGAGTQDGVPFYSQYTFNLKSQVVTRTPTAISSSDGFSVVTDKKTDPGHWLSAIQSMIYVAERISEDGGDAVKASMAQAINGLKNTLGLVREIKVQKPVQIVVRVFKDLVDIQLTDFYQTGYVLNQKTHVISFTHGSNMDGGGPSSLAGSPVQYKQMLQIMRKLISDAVASLPPGIDRRDLEHLQKKIK